MEGAARRVSRIEHLEPQVRRYSDEVPQLLRSSSLELYMNRTRLRCVSAVGIAVFGVGLSTASAQTAP